MNTTPFLSSLREEDRSMKVLTKKQPVTLNGNNLYIVEVRTDSLADINPPDPTWAVGSIAWVIKDSTTETGKIYGLTSSGEWVEQLKE